MNELRLRARAKINLTLDVLGKMPDGYHEIKTIMQTVFLSDEVFIRRKEKPEIELQTNLSYLPNDSRNIAVMAAEAFFAATQLKEKGIYIHITKNIPVAAGLAGGSADGAAVIRGLDALFDTRLSEDTLCKIGAQVGSDVPFCLLGGTALACGRGDILTPLKPAPFFHVVLVKPPFSVSTKKAYADLDNTTISIHPHTEESVLAIEKGDAKALASRIYNVMEPPVAAARKEIGEIRRFLLQSDAAATAMSGSGPTVFGLFNEKEPAGQAAAALKKIYHETFLTAFCKKSPLEND